MIQCSEEPRLELERRQPFRIIRHRPGRDLDGHIPAQSFVSRLVYFPHAVRRKIPGTAGFDPFPVYIHFRIVHLLDISFAGRESDFRVPERPGHG